LAKPDWLIARPIAHRGLHDAAVGRIENTATAALAAIAGSYAIECDVQISADGEAMVFHDDDLDRLTEGRGPVASLSAADLERVAFKNTTDTMMTLGDYCDLIDGRVTLIVEIKSRFDGDRRLAERVVKVLGAYNGPTAAMSFDPGTVSIVRNMAPGILRGIVAERRYSHKEWNFLTRAQKRNLAWMLHADTSRPQFIAYHINDLPAAVPRLARAFGLPILTWTVRTDAQRQIAKRNADQMIFEGFRA
jgi:glycerophosphoryl diester phosphodiesterase